MKIQVQCPKMKPKIQEKQIEQYLYSLYPKEVVEKLLQGHLQPQMQDVTILFTDLEDFTEYSSNHSPEQIVQELQSYFNQMSEIILNHNGWIDKFIGDSIMALFGIPNGNYSHAEDALLAATEMQKFMRKNIRNWRQRIGINTGSAIIGNIGSSQKPSYTAIGDSVNLSNRLCKIARPREIIIGPQTYSRSKEKFKFESLGNIAVKGRGHVETHRVLY